jgi:ribonuclease-3
MEILNLLQINPKDEKLYETAFTHSSFAHENQESSYERLEFLGDSVLQVLTSNYLYKNQDLTEGEMTKLRSYYVCEDALYDYAISIGLNEYIKLGRGEEISGGKYRKAIVADVFEAFLGAIFIDQGFDYVNIFFEKYIVEIMEKNKKLLNTDYKSILQELLQTEKRTLKYIITNEEGPAHDKVFKVEVRIDDIVYGVGVGHSKKQAEQNAAKASLEKSITSEETWEEHTK